MSVNFVGDNIGCQGRAGDSGAIMTKGTGAIQKCDQQLDQSFEVYYHDRDIPLASRIGGKFGCDILIACMGHLYPLGLSIIIVNGDE